MRICNDIFRVAVALLACAALFASCDGKSDYNTQTAKGTLSFSLKVDESTKAVGEASGDYYVAAVNSDGVVAFDTTYSALKGVKKAITLPVGSYTLVARSTKAAPKNAEFDNPVFGVSAPFSILGGQNTSLDSLVCRLLQTVVNISYDEAFLANVTGDGTTTVTTSSSLDYALAYNGGNPTFETRNGYFLVDNGTTTTMTVEFDGYYGGKRAVMRKIFTGIEPATAHMITFVNGSDVTGNAGFNISIDGFICDEELVQDIVGLAEKVIGEDPYAPTGDGGIELQSTCSFDISKPIAVPPAGTAFTLTMRALVPNSVKKFTVEINSTSGTFVDAVKRINGGSNVLDLVNPSAGAKEVFTSILPFPYGDAVNGKSDIPFDLSDAQEPILAFPGEHTFIMHVTDQKACRKDISIVMTVAE